MNAAKLFSARFIFLLSIIAVGDVELFLDRIDRRAGGVAFGVVRAATGEPVGVRGAVEGAELASALWRARHFEPAKSSGASGPFASASAAPRSFAGGAAEAALPSGSGAPGALGSLRRIECVAVSRWTRGRHSARLRPGSRLDRRGLVIWGGETVDRIARAFAASRRKESASPARPLSWKRKSTSSWNFFS